MKIFLLLIALCISFSTATAQTGWSKQTSYTQENLKRVQFFSRTNGWICGQEGNAYRTTDGGINWTKVPHPLDYYYVYFQNDSTGYAVGQVPGPLQQNIIKTSDQGITWSEPADYQLSGFGFTDMAHVGVDSLFIISNSSGNGSRSTDGGNTWTKFFTNLAYVNAISFSDSKRGYIIGNKTGNQNYAGFARTIDGGQTWLEKISGMTTDMMEVFPASSTNLIAVGDFEHIYQSTNEGDSWDSIPYPITSNAYYSITFSDNQNGTIVGAPGLIRRTTDGGQTWEYQNSTIRYPIDTTAIIFLWSVSFVDSLHGWSCGDGGIILHTSDAGKTWVKQYLPKPLTTSVSPEPFGRKTSITYELPTAMKVKIRIYDILGKELEVLESPGIQDAGTHSIEFDGSRYPEGTFHYRIETDGFYGTGKMTKVVY